MIVEIFTGNICGVSVSNYWVIKLQILQLYHWNWWWSSRCKGGGNQRIDILWYENNSRNVCDCIMQIDEVKCSSKLKIDVCKTYELFEQQIKSVLKILLETIGEYFHLQIQSTLQKCCIVTKSCFSGLVGKLYIRTWSFQTEYFVPLLNLLKIVFCW